MLAFAGLLSAAFVPVREVILVGSGEHVYEWVGDWAKLPEGVELGSMHGEVVVDQAGNVYVETLTEKGICVFSADGVFLRSIAGELASGLHGLAIAAEDGVEFLYVAQAVEGMVYKLALDGTIVWSIGWPEESGKYEGGKKYHPTSVAVAPNGDVYVADGYGRSYIHRFDRERKYLGTFGGAGKEIGQVKNPHGLWIEERDGELALLVADRENRRVQVFDLGGKPREVWTDGIRRPCFIEPRGDVYALADIDGKVTLLDRAGKPLVHLGENPDPAKRDRNDLAPADIVPGVFASPHGLAWARDGSLYVVEWLEHGRITKLVPHRREHDAAEQRRLRRDAQAPQQRGGARRPDEEVQRDR